MVGLTSRCTTLAALAHLVAHVVRVCADEEVVGVDARRVIASVENLFAWRDWSIGELPGDTVGALRPSVDLHHAVPWSWCGSGELDASGLLVQLAEAIQALADRYLFGWHER